MYIEGLKGSIVEGSIFESDHGVRGAGESVTRQANSELQGKTGEERTLERRGSRCSLAALNSLRIISARQCC